MKSQKSTKLSANKCKYCGKEVSRSDSYYCKKHQSRKFRIIAEKWSCVDCGATSTPRWHGSKKETLQCSHCYHASLSIDPSKQCVKCSGLSIKWFNTDSGQICNSCYRKNVLFDKKLSGKTCDTCGTDTTLKWYKNTCRRCYRRIKSQELREIDIDKWALQQLKTRIRVRVIKALKGKVKSVEAMKDVGCSIAELKIYFESLFQPGMSWENYGKKSGTEMWEIDHIIPLCSVDLTDPEQLAVVCHFTNLRPLWYKDHKEKTKEEQNGSYSKKRVDRNKEDCSTRS